MAGAKQGQFSLPPGRTPLVTTEPLPVTMFSPIEPDHVQRAWGQEYASEIAIKVNVSRTRSLWWPTLVCEVYFSLNKSTCYLSLSLSEFFLRWDIKNLSSIRSWNQVLWVLTGFKCQLCGFKPQSEVNSFKSLQRVGHDWATKGAYTGKILRALIVKKLWVSLCKWSCF